MATINYVKFQRGTVKAYELLKSNSQLDNNTLYFIYDSKDSTSGTLYLGSRMIAGGNNGSLSLSDLSDVLGTDVAKANSFLVKDNEGNWQAKTLQEVIELIENNSNFVPQGDNKSVEVVDDKVQLKNFGAGYYKYVAAVKDEGGAILEPSSYQFVEGEFVAGLEPRVIDKNGQLEIAWYEPSTETAEGVSAKVESLSKSLEEVQESLNDKANSADVYTKTQTDAKIKEAINNADHLRRTIVTSKEEIDVSAEGAGSFIYMVPNENGTDGDRYDEYVVIDGKIEKVGSWAVDLSDYATTEELETLQAVVDKNQEEISESLQKITDKLASAVTSANEDNFTITNGHLALKAITVSQISDVDTLQYIKSVSEDFKVSEAGQLTLLSVSASALKPVLGDVTLLGNTVVEQVIELDKRLTWQEMAEEE